MAQHPTRTDDERFIADLLPHFRDPRYIRVDGKPLLIVYRIGFLPDPRATAELWRETCRREGIGELYLCAAKTYDTADPTVLGFDASIEFPPHAMRTPPANARFEITNPDFRGQIIDYREFVLEALSRAVPAHVVHPTVMPAWDNAPRRPDTALTFVNATPEIYEIWLREAVARTVERHAEPERLVFINAWNEWAEGAHLEPDQRYGHQYLQATLRALTNTPVGGQPYARFSGRKSGVTGTVRG